MNRLNVLLILTDEQLDRLDGLVAMRGSGTTRSHVIRDVVDSLLEHDPHHHLSLSASATPLQQIGGE